MTPKERAAMQQALDALELARGSHGVMLMSNPPHDAWQYRGCDSKLAEAITALREALAEQAEQEPVAWLVQYKDCHTFVWGRKPEFIVDGVVEPLYAAPVRTKDLTDDEIREIEMSVEPFAIDLARAVIAADREKNK